MADLVELQPFVVTSSFIILTGSAVLHQHHLCFWRLKAPCQIHHTKHANQTAILYD
jgi:hypothetical protein